MSRYGSAGNAKPSLTSTFFLSETDNRVTRFYFIIPFINYTMFLIFFEKLLVAQGPLSINRERGVILQEVEYVTSAPCG